MTAAELWARGLNVFDVPLPRPGAAPNTPGDGKTPDRPWGQWQATRQMEEDVRRLFQRRANIAIVTGAISGVVVIDVDSRQASEWAVIRLPYTPWQTRTTRGYHLFYQHPGIEVRNRAKIDTRGGKIAIDVRGDGGYVIGPGSLHASGARYEAAGDWTIPRAALPRFWPGWLARPARPAALVSPRTPRPTGDAIDRARRYLAAIPPPTIGNGSDAATLYAACRLVRGFDLAPGDAEALLWDWAGGRPGWTPEWIAAKVAHAARYGTEPVGALR